MLYLSAFNSQQGWELGFWFGVVVVGCFELESWDKVDSFENVKIC